MADYYPLIARAVSGLEKNTGEARRSLYERARAALVTQLRGTTPPMSESDITKERLALEEAIRKIEAECARKVREAQAAQPQAPQSAPAADGGKPVPTGQGRPSPSSTKPKIVPRPATAEAPPAAKERRPLSDEGLKGFRDVVAEAEGLGEATAQASRTAREAYAAMPAPHADFERIEPRVEPEGLRPPLREQPAPRSLEPPIFPDAAPAGAPRQVSRPSPVEPEHRKQQSRRGLFAALLTVVVLILVGAGLFWQRERVAATFSTVKSSAVQEPKDPAVQRPKIPDRVGQPQQEAAATPEPRSGAGQQVAPVAQRVVLYEEDPAEPAGRRYVGSAVWRNETISGGPGQPADLAVRADVEIPERRINMTLTLRRNTDQTLPASHTIEVMFNLPADFPFGGVSNVPGILMKQAEQTRGSPLAGLAVKVTSGFFLVGLSAVEADQQRNLQLLRERSWFDIPIVYGNGRRAILAVEKGNPGDRVFAEAFARWGSGG